MTLSLPPIIKYPPESVGSSPTYCNFCFLVPLIGALFFSPFVFSMYLSRFDPYSVHTLVLTITGISPILMVSGSLSMPSSDTLSLRLIGAV